MVRRSVTYVPDLLSVVLPPFSRIAPSVGKNDYPAVRDAVSSARAYFYLSVSLRSSRAAKWINTRAKVN